MTDLICALLLTLSMDCHQPTVLAASGSTIDQRILIDAAPHVRTVAHGEATETRFVVAPDGPTVTADMMVVITMPEELPVDSYRLSAGNVPNFLCVKLSRLQLLCLANGVTTTNYVTVSSTVAGAWCGERRPHMLIGVGSTVAGIGAVVRVDCNETFFPWVETQ